MMFVTKVDTRDLTDPYSVATVKPYAGHFPPDLAYMCMRYRVLGLSFQRYRLRPKVRKASAP
jgi:hypothetical protein